MSKANITMNLENAMLPKTFRDLATASRAGATFEVSALSPVEEFETYLEPGMKLSIINSTHEVGCGADEVIRLELSYHKYDEHNKAFESKNYYGRDGVPNKTARETGNYNVIDSLFVMADFDPNKYFSMIKDTSAKLYAAYLNEKVGDETYVAYLERLVEAHAKAV